MTLTQAAVVLVGAWMILTATTAVSTTLTLVLGIVVIVLVVLDGRTLFSRRI